jgi:hypothetical protein
MQAFSEAALPGRYLVNNLPFLKYVPSWLPGAGWKRKCQYIASVNKRTLYDSFESVKESLVGDRFLRPLGTGKKRALTMSIAQGPSERSPKHGG